MEQEPGLVRSHGQELRWLQDKAIAFIGDSVTADLRSNYVTLAVDELADHLDLGAMTIVNSGVDSSSVLDALDRLPDVLLENDPDVVVVFLGINDSKIFRHINRPLISPSVFEASYAAFLDRLDAARLRHKVVLTLPPLLYHEIETGTYLADYWYWRPKEYAQYVQAIRNVAERPNCVVADVFDLFTQHSSSSRRLFYEDGVHPNIYGHRLIARAVVDALATIGRGLG